MHPTLVSLLTHAVVSNPKPGIDKAGDPVLFHRAGQFPSADDPEFQVAKDARAVYKSGELPILLRNLAPVSARLGMPYQFTAYISSYAGQVLLVLIPLLALIVPLTRALPATYVWMVRRRLVYWYRQLKALERSLDSRDAQARHCRAPGGARADRWRGEAHSRSRTTSPTSSTICVSTSLSSASGWRRSRACRWRRNRHRRRGGRHCVRARLP